MIENNLLYIIGNGFDLHHDFPTSYDHFDSFMEDWSPEMYYEIQSYWEFKIRNGKWSDFENDLSTYNSRKMLEEFSQSDRDLEYITDQCAGVTQRLYKGINNCFIEWIKNIQLQPLTQKVKLNSDAQYITFNYTRTLYEIYNISDKLIWHIHGSSFDNEVIFGHKVREEIEYNYSDDTGMPSTEQEWREEVSRYAKLPLNQFRKKTEQVITKNQDQFLKYQNLHDIYILGHSLGDVDLPYFEVLNGKNMQATWYVSYYNDSDQEYLSSQLKKVGVQEFQIKLIKMDDIKLDSPE